MVKTVCLTRAGNVIMSRHQVSVVAWDVETSGMMPWTQADVVTAIKAAESMMRAVSIRHSRTPALVLDMRTLRLLLQLEVGADSVVRLVVVLAGWDDMRHVRGGNIALVWRRNVLLMVWNWSFIQFFWRRYMFHMMRHGSFVKLFWR